MIRDIIITPTTHWDREWVQPQIQFQIRLVQLVDRLMDILEQDPAFTSFLFDGQTLPLEDDLAIKPGNRERLAKLVRAGRILVGPWYVLADQFLQDGEATVRNLMLGFRQSRELGAEPMGVCYVPDSFGCIGSLPMIAAGFGLKYAMFGRGRPTNLPTDQACFRWAGPDGSTVLAANHGYGSGLFLAYPNIWTNLDAAPPDPAAALNTLTEMLPGLAARENTDTTYLSAGIDHLEARAGLTGVIAHLNRHLPESCACRIAGPDAYFAAVEQAAPSLVTYTGEMRGPDVKVFNGCTSSRMDLKQANASAQRWLESYVEPLSVFASLLGREYPREFCDHLWRLLLINHPHDSICACSLDRVGEDMANRYARIEEAAVMLSELAMHAVTAQVNTHHPAPDAAAIVVFNTLGASRNGIVRQAVRFPRRVAAPFLRLVDETGQVVPAHLDTGRRTFKDMDLESLPMTTAQLSSLLSKNARPERPGHDVFTVLPVEFVAPAVPGLGHRTFWLVPVADGEANAAAPDLQLTPRGMANRFLEVTFNADGTFDLLDRQTGRRLPALHHFEDTEDIGDAYGHQHYPRPDLRTTRGAQAIVRVVDTPPHRITWEVVIPWMLPETSNAGGRNGRLLELTLTSEITLYADTDRVEIVTRFDHACRNHRLRAVFDTGIQAAHSVAEGNFSLVERPVPTPETSMESYPQQRFVSIADADGGLAVFNRGLPEFEAVRTGHGTRLSLTLLRAVGTLGPRAGADHPVPGAQGPGPHTMAYALRPVRPGESGGDLLQAALDYATPLAADGASQHAGPLPTQGAFVTIAGPVVVTALKRAERDADWVVRLWNPTPAAAAVTISLPAGLARATRTDLDERPQADLPLTHGAAACTVPARGLATVKLRPG